MNIQVSGGLEAQAQGIPLHVAITPSLLFSVSKLYF